MGDKQRPSEKERERQRDGERRDKRDTTKETNWREGWWKDGSHHDGGRDYHRWVGPHLQNVATPSRVHRSDRAHGRAWQAPEGERRPSSQLEEVMRKKGVEEAWNALEEMQKSGVTTDKFTVSRMLMKTVGDGRTRLNASKVYRGIALVERFVELQPEDVDEVLFNALLDTCCRLKDMDRLEATVQSMRELKVTPSPVTLGILVKTYGQAGDLPKVLQVWSEMEKQRVQANAVTYGCMIDACVKCGHLSKAVDIFTDMKRTGKHKNTILYTTLIKGYGLDKDLLSAIKLFREMATEGVPYNTITYNSIIDVCIKCDDVPQAEKLLLEMTSASSTVEPDLITFSTLLKGYCNIGELDKALQTAETIKARKLRCDELVYNTLIDGCVKANDITAGLGLFEEMLICGMRPSSITHSILIRLYQRAGYDEDTSEAVAQLYQHHGLERPSGGDRGKYGRKARSPPISPAVGFGAGHSPLGSPASGLGSQGSQTPWSCAEIPLLNGFGFGSELSSEPGTPMPSPGMASPVGDGPYLSMESLQGHPMPCGIPPLPGGSGAGNAVPPAPSAGGADPASAECPSSVAAFNMSQMPLWQVPCGAVPGSLPGGESSMGQGFFVQVQAAPGAAFDGTDPTSLEPGQDHGGARDPTFLAEHREASSPFPAAADGPFAFPGGMGPHHTWVEGWTAEGQQVLGVAVPVAPGHPYG